MTKNLLPPTPNRSFSDHERRIAFLERRIDKAKIQPSTGRARSTFVTVAASDTDETLAAHASYRCDGTADNVEIQAAHHARVGPVLLLPGTFNLSATVNVDTTVMANGEDGETVVNAPPTLPAFNVDGGVLKGFAVVGGASATYGIEVDANSLLHDLIVTGAATNAAINAFGHSTGIIDCRIQVTAGYSLFSSGDRQVIEGLRVQVSGATVGTIEISGDGTLFTGQFYVSSTTSGLCLSIGGGDSNFAMFTADAPVATGAQAVTISAPSDDNLVLYTKRGTFIADSDAGTGNRINPFAAGTEISETVIDAKGDLIVGTAPDTVARQAVGADGQVLTADSTAAAGVKWATSADITDAFVPYFLASGETFTVPQYRQALFVDPIDAEGTIILDGLLIEVSQPPDLSALVHMGAA